MLKHLFITVFIVITSINLFAQRGKNGTPTIPTTNTIVNSYTTLTNDVNTGAVSLIVGSNLLNTSSFMSGNLAAGDLIMIIQMQGASVNGVMGPFGVIGAPNDTAWGKVTNLNNCGNYELVQVNNVPVDGITINLDCGIKNSYTTAGKVQVIRVPRFNSLTVGATVSIAAASWNGTTGGVVAIEVENNTVLNNATASINGTGLGFRGGTPGNDNSSVYGSINYSHTNPGEGAEKGESVYGWLAEYDVIGGRYGKGAIGNAGGGGNAHNGAGGGGANGGNDLRWKGTGNPDISTANYITAWKLEGNRFDTTTSSGGGRGGYTFSSSNQNELTLAPGAGAWGGDARRNQGGYGGHPLDYTSGYKAFMGGGGGGGDEDNGVGGDGGAGGAIIYLMNYGTISGSGKIVSNGAVGQNPIAANGNNRDGSGGAGGGGAVLVNSVGTISGIIIDANGGVGGSQVFGFGFTGSETEGPGGGGGGGYIAVSNGTITKNANGGNNGTTNASQVSNFPPNGATKGGAGINYGSVTNFTIVANDVVACPGGTVTLTASLSGTVPSGTVIQWYTAAAGGNSIANGSSYITPVINSPTTYYVGTCPGTYRVPVNITLSGGAVADAGSDMVICAGGFAVLNGNGGLSCLWNFDNTLNDSNLCSPTASPLVDTEYILTVTDVNGCTDKDTVNVIIGTGISFTLSNDTSVCEGNSVVLNASTNVPGVTFNWTPSTNLSSGSGNQVIATVSDTTKIYCTASNAFCSSTDSVTINIQQSHSINVIPSNPLLCNGDTILLVVTNDLGLPINYVWTGSSGLINNNNDSVYVNPSASINYSVNASYQTCSVIQSVPVTVNNNPVITLNTTNVSMCSGDSVNLTVSGAFNYAWSPGTTITPNVSDSSIYVHPTGLEVYQVIGYTAAGCSDTAYATVNVTINLNVNVSASSTRICQGSSATLTASGAPNYTWTPSATLNAASGINVIASPTTSTTYIVTGTSGSCSDTAMVLINVDTLVNLSVTPASASICEGSSVSINATGAVNYSWTPSASLSSNSGATVIASPLTTQTYTVTGTNGVCTNSATATINVDTLITVNVSALTTTICSGTSTTLTATGAPSYSWTPAATLNTSSGSVVTASPTGITTYTVTGINGACNDTAMIVINVDTPVSLSVSPANSTICAGSTLSLTATGATSYSWSPATGLNVTTGANVNANPNSTQTYTINGANGVCTGIAIAIVNVDPAISVNVTASGNTICQGSSTNLTATGAANYSWTPSATLSSSIGSSVVATPTAGPITYIVTGTSGVCVNSDSVTITVNPIPVVSVNNPASNICAGGSVTIIANGATTYAWTPSTGLNVTSGSTVISSTAANVTYVVTGTLNGCSSNTTAVVNVNPVPLASFVNNTDTVCLGSCFNFNDSSTVASPGVVSSWNWTFGDGTTGSSNSVTHCFATAGNYAVTLNVGTSNCASSNSATHVLVVNNSATASFAIDPSDTVHEPGAVIIVNNTSTNANGYSWDFDNGAVSNVFSPASQTYPDEGNFVITLIAFGNNGCNDTAKTNIKVKKEIPKVIPNVFSPNGDNKNEQFIISGYEISSLQIFNRWGQVIYKTSANVWDGNTQSGSAAVDGVYFYIVVFSDGDKKEGYVSLVR